MGHNPVIQLETLHYICLPGTADITQFWGTVWKHRTHILLLFKHLTGIYYNWYQLEYNWYIVPNCSSLTLYSVFFIKERVIYFLFMYIDEEIHYTKLPRTLNFCSNKATSISFFFFQKAHGGFIKHNL